MILLKPAMVPETGFLIEGRGGDMPPAVQKIQDHNVPNASALRITRRKATKKKGAHMCVRCGCCNKEVCIFPPIHIDDPYIEINGVMGTRAQWQQVFGELLHMKSIEEPRILDDYQ